MKLFLVRRTDDVWWDQFRSFVVVARNKRDALVVCGSDRDTWVPVKERHTLEVVPLGVARTDLNRGIIQSDFKAG